MSLGSSSKYSSSRKYFHWWWDFTMEMMKLVISGIVFITF
jgi:hypothetical protein